MSHGEREVVSVAGDSALAKPDRDSVTGLRPNKAALLSPGSPVHTLAKITCTCSLDLAGCGRSVESQPFVESLLTYHRLHEDASKESFIRVSPNGLKSDSLPREDIRAEVFVQAPSGNLLKEQIEWRRRRLYTFRTSIRRT